MGQLTHVSSVVAGVGCMHCVPLSNHRHGAHSGRTQLGMVANRGELTWLGTVYVR